MTPTSMKKLTKNYSTLKELFCSYTKIPYSKRYKKVT